MCEHLHYESVYFKELHKEQEYYIQGGAAVVSTITSKYFIEHTSNDVLKYSYFPKQRGSGIDSLLTLYLPNLWIFLRVRGLLQYLFSSTDEDFQL